MVKTPCEVKVASPLTVFEFKSEPSPISILPEPLASKYWGLLLVPPTIILPWLISAILFKLIELLLMVKTPCEFKVASPLIVFEFKSDPSPISILPDPLASKYWGLLLEPPTITLPWLISAIFANVTVLSLIILVLIWTSETFPFDEVDPKIRSAVVIFWILSYSIVLSTILIFVTELGAKLVFNIPSVFIWTSLLLFSNSSDEVPPWIIVKLVDEYEATPLTVVEAWTTDNLLLSNEVLSIEFPAVNWILATWTLPVPTVFHDKVPEPLVVNTWFGDPLFDGNIRL